jgi:hypothetical protein
VKARSRMFQNFLCVNSLFFKLLIIISLFWNFYQHYYIFWTLEFTNYIWTYAFKQIKKSFVNTCVHKFWCSLISIQSYYLLRNRKFRRKKIMTACGHAFTRTKQKQKTKKNNIYGATCMHLSFLILKAVGCG